MLVALGGDQLGKWLPVCIAAAMPDWECRFVGQLWSNGYHARRAGYAYRHWGWRRSRAKPFAPGRNLSDLQFRGLSWQALSPAHQRALGELRDMLEGEVRTFQPDVALYLNAESVMGHLTSEIAAQAGIPAVGLQTLYTPHRLLVHAWGEHWCRALAAVAGGGASLLVPELAWRPGPDHTGMANQTALRTASFRLERRLRWLNRAERWGRAMLGGPSLDVAGSWRTKLAAARSHGALKELGALTGAKVLTAPIAGAAVLLLHRPVLRDRRPDWTDLVRFALQALPAHWPLVLRTHPDEAPLDWPVALASALRDRGQIWLSQSSSGPDLAALLAPARLALTLTSSAGVHALRLGVPTLALDQAYYVGPGLAEALDLQHPQLLSQRLKQGDLPPPDAHRLSRLMADVEARWTAPCPPLSPEVVPASALAEMVLARLQWTDPARAESVCRGDKSGELAS